MSTMSLNNPIRLELLQDKAQLLRVVNSSIFGFREGYKVGEKGQVATTEASLCLFGLESGAESDTYFSLIN